VARRPAAPSSPKRLQGKIALVTGATRGLGLAMARALAREGCGLVICGRDAQALKSAEKELSQQGSAVLAKICDVGQEAEVKDLIGATRRTFGRLDVLINNAGIGHAAGNVQDFSSRVWQDVINTNLTAVFFVTRHALPLMHRGGTIVNNLSVSAKRVFPGSAAYTASKFGALGLTNTLREELRPRAIRVIALLAGATDTEIWDTLWPEAPRRKMMTAESVAQAVLAAVLLPESTVVEEITVMPIGGAL
jgi:NAD(P)-dependent dehydrogenase (short-subunit alcohol dehydrogenase family)